MSRLQKLIDVNGKWIADAIEILREEPVSVALDSLGFELYDIEQFIAMRKKKLSKEIIAFIANKDVVLLDRANDTVITPDTDFIDLFFNIKMDYKKLVTALKKGTLATELVEKMIAVMEEQNELKVVNVEDYIVE